MNQMPETSKLAYLRAKTDRQLTALITRRLDDALALARGRRYLGDEFCRPAEAAYRDASRLLPLIFYASKAERTRLESAMAELRRLLDGASRPIQARAACF